LRLDIFIHSIYFSGENFHVLETLSFADSTGFTTPGCYKMLGK